MNLFPVFNINNETKEDSQKALFPDAPLFDTKNGEFISNGAGGVKPGSGYDAWVLWCVKTIMTQRGAHLGYSQNTGIDAEEAFNQPDRAAAESAFERTITEAILQDPLKRTRVVRDFTFNWRGDSLQISCVIISADGNTAVISAEI